MCQETSDLYQVVNLKTDSALLQADPLDPFDVLRVTNTNVGHRLM